MMNTKCIAIGNRIMKDDGIAIYVVETIKDKLLNEGISVTICETDLDYALQELNYIDQFIIIDSSCYDIEPGTITVTSIDHQPVSQGQVYSQHQPNLIDLIQKYKISVKGFIIGIEVDDIAYSLQLSDCLLAQFNRLCEEVYHCILDIVKENNYA